MTRSSPSRGCLARFLPSLLAVLPYLLPVPALATDVLPLRDVRPGMKGVGRTVFEGARIEEFSVEVIGVLENTGPRQSMVVARLTGGPLAETGVIAGMSGSPVYVDGRLLGAVAYGFPFSKETIAGITPIEEMLEATATGAARAASARFPAPFRADAPAAPLGREQLVTALRRPLGEVPVSGAGRFRLAPGSPAALAPLALPLTFSGFDPAAFAWAREVFASLGFAPVAGPGGGVSPRADLPPLEPGSPVGVSLVEGDLDISVTGTVTHVDGDRVWAFGHPFYNLGPTRFPLRKAYVHGVFPSLYQSWKISSPAEHVGTVDQDRISAVAGRLGAPPRMIPVEVVLVTSRGAERTFSFRLVEDELFTPALAYVSLLSVLQSNERAFGAATIRVEGRLTLSGGREIVVEDVFAEPQPVPRAAALLAAPLAYLLSNEFESVSAERLAVEVRSQEVLQTSRVERAWLERKGPIRPGSTLPVKVALRSHRGVSRVQTVEVAIPASAPAGPHTLLVADAETVNLMEQREMRQPFVPRDLEQLVRAVNSLRRHDRLYVRLLRPEPGVILGGEYLQSLPPSVLAVLGGREGAGSVVPIRTSTAWETELFLDEAVSGSRVLALTVER